jgi:hypothetical protein
VEAHHCLPRARGGDDVAGNLLGLCTVCHTALHGGAARSPDGTRVTAQMVRTAIGFWLGRDAGTATRAYLIQKLGRRPATAFMANEYGVRS